MADTPESVARTGVVRAQTILDQAIDLRGYPHRLLTVVSDRGVGGQQVTLAVSAAEILTRTGWDLIAMFPYGTGNTVYGVMQRRNTHPA